MTANKKKVLAPKVMSRAGWEILEARDDVEAVPYLPMMPTAEFHALLADADAVALALTPYRAQELAVSPRMRVVARIGVGYDSVEVPALTAKKVPLMIAGTANSVSVAEQAFSMMLHLAKLNVQHDAAVRAGTWRDQMKAFPIDLYGKTLLVIGFGRIGTRTAKRGVAFEMRTLIYDPYVQANDVKAIGAEPVAALDAAIREADFITVHCPKTAETTNMFDARRLGLMKPTAYIINTARGGIVDERALSDALAAGKIAGAGVDVFEKEPAAIDHPLLKFANVVVAPHMAGVTREAMDRMAVNTVRNILSVLDGQPNRDNAVNPEVFG